MAQNLSEEQRLYVACLYGYSLRPESWQRDYTWPDFVADSDFSFKFGVEDKNGLAIDESQASAIYSDYRTEIERTGLDEFYELHFGKYYKHN